MSDRERTVALQRYLSAKQRYLAGFVSGRVKPETLVRFALADYAKSPHLQRCSQESILLALVAAAQCGLEPSGVKGEAYIVPFKTTATFMPGYRGLVRLAREAGVHPRAHVVYAGDEFEAIQGTEERIVHKPTLGERGEFLAAYALARVIDDYETCIMPRAEIEKVREQARNRNGGKDSPAWSQWFDEMARKTALRRLAKTLPAGEQFERAVRIDNAVSSGDVAAYRDAIDIAPDAVREFEPAEVPNESNELLAAINAAETMDQLETLASDARASSAEVQAAYVSRRGDLLKQ